MGEKWSSYGIKSGGIKSGGLPEFVCATDESDNGRQMNLPLEGDG